MNFSRKQKKSLNVMSIIRLICLIFVTSVYLFLFNTLKFNRQETKKEEVFEEKIFKLVDVQEYIPRSEPKIPVPPAPVPKQEEVKEIESQPEHSENIIETKEEIVEKPRESNPDDEFIPQQKVSVIPVIPGKKLIKRIEYPSQAYKDGIEGVVYLELYIDAKGIIKKIKVLKDPGYGFAEAAVKAFDGLICQPAIINGEAVPVRFRYPVRFSLR